MRVTRPIVRQFKSRFVAEIAKHVRGGGHAVVWETPSRGRLVYPPAKEGEKNDLALWSLLDLGKSRFTVVKTGALKGFRTAPLPKDCFEIVRHRAERDSIHRGTTRTVDFDCLACGACCKDNEVILDTKDVKRFADGGRPDLAKPPYTRTKDGTLYLRLLKSKDCRHLQGDNKCAIYPLRPDACSTFPVASEPCLFSREDGLGITDGATAVI